MEINLAYAFIAAGFLGCFLAFFWLDIDIRRRIEFNKALRDLRMEFSQGLTALRAEVQSDADGQAERLNRLASRLHRLEIQYDAKLPRLLK